MALEIRHMRTGLNLPRVEWDGGAQYWAQFPKAHAAGWSDPSFFPIGVFLGKCTAGHPAVLASLGINVLMAIEHQPPMSDATDHLFVIAQSPVSHAYQLPDTWTQAEIGSDPGVVGWFIYDECEMAMGVCGAVPTDAGRRALHQGWVDDTRAFDDGRFMFTNYGNGVTKSHWAIDPVTFESTMHLWMAQIDACAVDKYAYTSSDVQYIIEHCQDWPGDPDGVHPLAERAAAYGWFMDQMHNSDALNSYRRPVWGFFETKMPYITEAGRRIILYAELRGAVWSAICHGATGICYFQHNGFYDETEYPGGPSLDPNTGLAPTDESYSLVEGQEELQDYVAAINAQILSLAPVLNTQSYQWDCGATGIDTMLKMHDGFAYVFASVGIEGTLGSKTFTVPTSVTGATAVVVDESRSVAVTSHQFSDSFAAEYSHHIYKIAL